LYTIHATKKLLDRVRHPVGEATAAPSTALGNWYANALFWKPQVALFLNESTLLPVLVPLAPASSVTARFPEQLARVLDALGVPGAFVRPGGRRGRKDHRASSGEVRRGRSLAHR